MSAAYFSNIENGVDSEASFVGLPSVVGSVGSKIIPPVAINIAAGTSSTAMTSDSLGLSYLIRAYQTRGHEIANLDPLGLHNYRDPQGPPELNYTYGLLRWILPSMAIVL